MERLRRGDIVAVAAGKPRPAVVVQANALLPSSMVIVVPLTSDVDDRPPPFTQMSVDPSPSNRLRVTSRAMIDRVVGVPEGLLRPTGGRLEDEKMTELTRLMALWLGIG